MSEKYVVVEYEEYHKYKEIVDKLKLGYTVVEKMNVFDQDVPTWQIFTLSPDQSVEQLTYKLRDMQRIVEYEKEKRIKAENNLNRIKEGNFLTKLASLFSKE